MIWYQIQAARIEDIGFCVIFFDLVNAFELPHSLYWRAFSYFQVLEKISTLVRAYLVVL